MVAFGSSGAGSALPLMSDGPALLRRKGKA
jgi:hypothetical protein